jgi:tetratricopeptide (TPR) repeat protein
MSNPDPLQALRDHADQLLASGNVPEAIVAHERLLAASPRSGDVWFNLAILQTQARRFEAALESYGNALTCGIAAPADAYLNRAVILAEQYARPDDAEQELRWGLSLDPRHVPSLVNLGNLHEQRGERAKAREAYEHVLEIDPDHALALARLPDLKPIDAGDALIARIKAALARPGVSSADRADLGFGLGKALDAVGAYDDAFAAYTEANRASRDNAGRRAVYDPVAHERFVDRLILAFPKRSDAIAPPSPVATPIFICGMFRSGSTLVEQILASHPRVTAGGEIDLIPQIARARLVPAGDAFAPIDAAELQRLRDAYLSRVAGLFPGADRVTDKRPDNFLYLGLIKSLFPDARIVHTQRDVLDNCLAVFFLHLGPSMPYALELRHIAHWHGQYVRLMAHWKSIYGDDIHDVSYDELVVRPRPVIERLLAFCGLDWNDACLAFHTTKTVVRTPSAWQVREPLYTRSSGRWRHYESHLRDLRGALARNPR